MEGEKKKVKDNRVRSLGNEGRCTKQRSKRVYHKKRKGFCKKQSKGANDSTLMSDNTGVIDSSTVSSVVDPASMETIISFEKITDVEDVIDRDNDVNNNNGNRLINMEMLANLFSPLTCPNCHESDCLQMEEDADKKKGLATFISIKCS